VYSPDIARVDLIQVRDASSYIFTLTTLQQFHIAQVDIDDLSFLSLLMMEMWKVVVSKTCESSVLSVLLKRTLQHAIIAEESRSWFSETRGS